MKRQMVMLLVFMTINCWSGIRSPFDVMGRLSPSQSFDGVLRTSGAGWVITSVPPRNANLSISLWFKAKSVANYNVLIYTGESSGYTAQGMLFYESAPYLTCNVGAYDFSPYTFNSTVYFDTDIWYHVVLTHTEYDADRLYINGVFDSQNFGIEGTSGAIGTFYLGTLNDSGAWLYDGYMDDVCIWDRAISAEEVASIFADNRATSPAVLSPSDVVDVFRFNNETDVVGDLGGTGTQNGDAHIVKFSEAN